MFVSDEDAADDYAGSKGFTGAESPGPRTEKSSTSSRSKSQVSLERERNLGDSQV